jgi:hypothetical protein
LSTKQDQDTSKTPQSWIRRQCDLCGVTCVTEKQWEAHARSRAHRRLVSKKRKLEEEEEEEEAGQVKIEKAEPKSDDVHEEKSEG